MGILSRYVRRYSQFSAKGWFIRQVVSVLDWDINDVFNDSTTQEVTGTVT